MLPENETPETSDLENNEPENQEIVEKSEENPIPVEQEVSQEETSETELPAAEVETTTEETPVAEETLVVTEESNSEVLASEDDGQDNESEDAEDASAENEDSSDESLKDKELVDESFPPLKEGIEEAIAELVKDRANVGSQTLDASIHDLIRLLDQYYKEEENVQNNIPKVGLIKRTFDAMSTSDSLDKGLAAGFHEALRRFNGHRSEFQKKQESRKIENTAQKEALLVELRKIVGQEDPSLYKEVRNLQDRWRDIGHVVKERIEGLYKDYRALLDKFYKLREMHFELMDYDRRINLQEKDRLINEAKGLVPPEEERENIDAWREKMDMLHELQQKWKTIGHVPREDMERVNNEYRAVIDNFFEVRQGFMAIQDQLRQENADKKEAILAQMKEFAGFDAPKPRAWNDATRILREHQEAWKKIGQAPQSVNSELWGRYREICNTFFSKKSEFFKKYDDYRAANLIKKRELVDEAEKLKESDEWEKSAKRLKQIQIEWKEAGPVPERQSNKLWNRFRAACDAFFESRRGHYQSLHSDENENLLAKKELIEEVKKISIKSEGSLEAAIAKIKALQGQWRDVGRVPYKEKDKIWKEFREIIDNFFNSLEGRRDEIRELTNRASFSPSSYKSEDSRLKDLKYQISNLRRKINKSEDKVNQYSTNIQFIAKGKSGDAFRNQIQKEIDKEKKVIEDLKKSIKQLNEMLKNPPKKEEPIKETPEVEEVAVETPVETETPTAEEPEVQEEAPVEEESAKEEAPAEEVVETPKAEESPSDEEKPSDESDEKSE